MCDQKHLEKQMTESIKKPGQVKVAKNEIDQKEDVKTLLLYLRKESKQDLTQVTHALAREGYTNSSGRQLRQNDIALWIYTRGVQAFNEEFGHLGDEFKISDPNY